MKNNNTVQTEAPNIKQTPTTKKLENKIPEGWEFYKLGDVVNYKKGYPFDSIDFINEGVRVIRISDTNANGIKEEGATFVSNQIAKNLKEWELKSSDIVIQTVGSRPPLYDSMVGKTILITENHLGSLLNQNAVRLRIKNGDNYFLYSHLKTKRYFDFIETLIRGNANQVSITLQDLFKFPIPHPPLQEQKAIANILSTWDEAIQKTQALISQKEQEKKWLMQNLLTGKKRLKGFENTKWKVQTLDTFVKQVIREIPKPSVPYLGIGLRSHGKGTFLKLDEQPEKNSMDKFYIVRPNDLIVNITFAWEQAIAIVKPEDNGALASHRFPTYEFILDKACPNYFRYVIIQPKMKFMLDLISPGGAGRNKVMNKSDFLKLELKIPSFEEQTAIAQVLQTADKEIALLKAKLEQQKLQKKGLMQVLLTGKVRVK